MKLFSLLLLSCAAIVHAASSNPAITISTEDGDGFVNIVAITFTTGEAHTAAADTFRVTLPTGVEMKDGLSTVADDLTFSCHNTITATDATYTFSYAKATKILTITKKTNTDPCVAGAATLTLKKVLISVLGINQAQLKIGNSKVAGTEAIAGSTATIAFAASTAGTLSALANPSTIGVTSTFAITFTPTISAAATTFILVYLPGFTVATTPVCTIGGTSVATISGGVFDTRIGYIKITGATSLWTATTEVILSCATGVTAPAAVQNADTVSLIVSTSATVVTDLSTLALPAVTTLAPTAAFSSAPTSAATSAFAFALCALVALFV